MQSRQSRMDKYYDSDIDIDESSVAPSRTKRNQELYKEVGTLDLKDFDLNNNVSIIGESTESINLDEIQDILSEKYRDSNRSKSIGDTEEIALPKINLDETREYDLNSILEKVKESKEIDYEEERLRKVRSSQYDILKDLDKLNNEEEIEEEDLDQEEVVEEVKQEVRVVAEGDKSERELLELIDTIVAKELISDDTDELPVPEINDDEESGELDPLDILSDLRGDDDTKVMGAIQIDEETENTLGLSTEEIALDEDDENDNDTDTDALEYIDEDEESVDSKLRETEEVKVTQVTEDTLSNSFATDSLKITDEDFDDFADLKEKGGIGKVLIVLLIIGLVVAFVVGLLMLLGKI